jgi:hypothetical protein
MVKRKLVFIGGQPYWGNKEVPQVPQEKKKNIFVKGLEFVGEKTVQAGKFIGKEMGKASVNFHNDQMRQQQMQQRNPNNNFPQKRDNPPRFPNSSGFGFP